MLRFSKFKSDRGSRKHGYDRVYNKIKPPVRMLEVGTQRGAGVLAWLDHFKDAEVVCIDINPCPELEHHKRATFIQGDSRIIKLEGTFDLIIDDAAHDPVSQLETFKNLFKYCTGTYFIEDVWPLDRLNNSKEFDLWCSRGNLKAGDYTPPKYNRLIRELSRHDLTRHDLRAGHNADSYLFEIHATEEE